jgi:hypothetical protein
VFWFCQQIGCWQREVSEELMEVVDAYVVVRMNKWARLGNMDWYHES